MNNRNANGSYKQVVIILTFVIAITASTVKAQRYAIIDMQYMLAKMPEYARVDTTLQLMALKWQREVDSTAHFADSLRKDFEAEQYMLADELKAKRMLQIQNADNEVHNLQTLYFGYQGTLFKKRAELIQPIQNKIYSMIQQLSVKNGWDFVLDKSAGSALLFSDPKLNKSDVILKAMGIRAK